MIYLPTLLYTSDSPLLGIGQRALQNRIIMSPCLLDLLIKVSKTNFTSPLLSY